MLLTPNQPCYRDKRVHGVVNLHNFASPQSTSECVHNIMILLPKVLTLFEVSDHAHLHGTRLFKIVNLYVNMMKRYGSHRATSPGTKVRTIVTQVKVAT